MPRIRHSWFALWIALCATLVHGLVPAGYMLGRNGASEHFGFMLCTGGVGAAALKMLEPSADHASPASSHASKDCPFAAAAMPALAGFILQLTVARLVPSAIRLAGLEHLPFASAHRLPPPTGPPFQH